MAKKTTTDINKNEIVSSESVSKANDTSVFSIKNRKEKSFWSHLGGSERIGIIAVCLLLVVGALGAGGGFGEKFDSILNSKDSAQNSSGLAELNPVAATLTTATPQLSKEYIYAGSRMLLVEDVLLTPTYEADVSPRGNGNGSVTSTDVSIIQGFQLGYNLPYQSNEFQRADCAPLSSRGDGVVSSIDVSQAQGYQLGDDIENGHPPLAAGPTGSGGNRFEYDTTPTSKKIKRLNQQSSVQTERGIRIVNTGIGVDGVVTVLVNVDAVGDESVYGFSLNYDSAKLSSPVVSIGAAGGILMSNTAQTGKIGVSVRYDNGGTIAAGVNRNLVKIQFNITPNAVAGLTPLSFGDAPTQRELASAPGAAGGVKALATNFTGLTLTIASTTTTTVAVPQ